MYRLISVVVNEDTMETEVEYTMPDGSLKRVWVHHFRPQNDDAVVANIIARGESEQSKMDSEALNMQIKLKLESEQQDAPSAG